MKKLFAMLFVASMVSFAACTSAETEEATDEMEATTEETMDDVEALRIFGEAFFCTFDSKKYFDRS